MAERGLARACVGSSGGVRSHPQGGQASTRLIDFAPMSASDAINWSTTRSTAAPSRPRTTRFEP